MAIDDDVKITINLNKLVDARARLLTQYEDFSKGISDAFFQIPVLLSNEQLFKMIIAKIKINLFIIFNWLFYIEQLEIFVCLKFFPFR